MGGFYGVKELVESIDRGATHYHSFRKTPAQVTIAGIWFDMSMSAGLPLPQYYAASPLVGQQLKKSTDGGFNHGPAVSPLKKALNRFLVMSNSATGLPMPWMLCDYIAYYPFIDTGINDEQILTAVSLPRYADGAGVQMMAVSVAPCSALLPTFTVNYTNSSGVSGRTSQPMQLN